MGKNASVAINQLRIYNADTATDELHCFVNRIDFSAVDELGNNALHVAVSDFYSNTLFISFVQQRNHF